MKKLKLQISPIPKAIPLAACKQTGVYVRFGEGLGIELLRKLPLLKDEQLFGWSNRVADQRLNVAQKVQNRMGWKQRMEAGLA